MRLETAIVMSTPCLGPGKFLSEEPVVEDRRLGSYPLMRLNLFAVGTALKCFLPS